MGSRGRIAVVVSYGLSVRYLLPTGLVSLLAADADVVLATTWDDPALEVAAEEVGAEVVRLPAPHVDHAFRRDERLLDLAFERRLASPTTAIARRWRRATEAPGTAALMVARRTRDQARRLVPGELERVARRHDDLAASATNLADHEAWLDAHGIDAVASLTPYHRSDHLLLLAARRTGRPTIGSLISFDNPTTRGRLPVLPDRILVWNERNRAELLRGYPDLEPGDVAAVGAPQFDLHRDPELVLDEAAWREVVGIPEDRPVVLYGAGPQLLYPHEDRLVVALDAAIAAGRIPGRPVVVLRGHPTEPTGRWRALDGLEHVVRTPEWGRADGVTAWPDRADTQLQLSSLAHAGATVSICSSMALDAAALDRPTVAPASIPGDGRRAGRRLRSFYRQEHWRAIAESGAVPLASSVDRLERLVAEHLADPSWGSAARRRLRDDLLRWDEGPAAPRVAAELVGTLAL